MDIIFKGRHTGIPERFRRFAVAKLSKIEKLDHKVIRVDVEVSRERNPRQSDRRERVELTIRHRGPVVRAEAAADDRYAAFDLALSKLEERLRRSHDRQKVSGGHAGSRLTAVKRAKSAAAEPAPGPQSGAEAPGSPSAAAGTQASAGGNGGRYGVPAQAQWEPGSDREAGEPSSRVVPIEMKGDGPLVVREQFHSAAPMTIDQALLQMELVGDDLYLFRDKECDHPSVVYRRRGYDYGVIRLAED